MAMNWNGFIKGVSDYGLERMKEERAMKMEKELAELREKYAIAAEQRAEKRSNAKEKRTRVDYDTNTNTGFEVSINELGEEINRSALSTGAMEELARNAKKGELDIADTQSQIDSRKETLAIQREGLNVDRDRIAAMREGNRAASGAVDAERGPRTPEGIVEGLASDLMSSYGYADITLDKPDQAKNAARIKQLARQAAWSAIQAGNPDLAFDMFDKSIRTNPFTND